VHWQRYRPARRTVALRVPSLRQDKSWKGGRSCRSETFCRDPEGRRPPGKGGARRPEASLAWVTATSLVKRRQRGTEALWQPRNHVSAEAFAVLGPGAASGKPLWPGIPVRPGSLSRAKVWEGSPGNLRGPAFVRMKQPDTERRSNNAPGLMTDLAASGARRRARTAKDMRNPEVKP
jgi:hypothetical protein